MRIYGFPGFDGVGGLPRKVTKGDCVHAGGLGDNKGSRVEASPMPEAGG